MKFDGKKVLVASPDIPYPPYHGGRVDVWGRVLALRRLGFRVDLIATAKEAPEDSDIRVMEEAVERFVWLKRDIRLSQILHPSPFQLVSRHNLGDVRLTDKYDLLLLEGEYVLPILDNPTLSADHIVLRKHNDEASYFRELAASVGPGKLKAYFLLESLKFQRLRASVARRIEHIAFISLDEYRNLSPRYPRSESFWLPPPVGERNGKYPSDSRTALCLGSFFMSNNREGMTWYLREIHPRLSDVPDYSLVIAGNSRGIGVGWLAELTSGYSNVRIVDSPTDLDPVYREASVFVCPILHGAGVKLKTIEAIQNGLPVVCTSVGNEGTGLSDEKHVLVADDAETFAARARELLMDGPRRRAMVSGAQDWIAENYDQERLLHEHLARIMCEPSNT